MTGRDQVMAAMAKVRAALTRQKGQATWTLVARMVMRYTLKVAMAVVNSWWRRGKWQASRQGIQHKNLSAVLCLWDDSMLY